MEEQSARVNWVCIRTRRTGWEQDGGYKHYEACFVPSSAFAPGADWDEVSICFWSQHPKLATKNIYKACLSIADLMALHNTKI